MEFAWIIFSVFAVMGVFAGRYFWQTGGWLNLVFAVICYGTSLYFAYMVAVFLGLAPML